MREPARCPRCDVTMLAGRVRVRGSVGGFLTVGFSWQHLWWTDPEGTRGSREILLQSGDECAAGRCPSCGMVAFMPPGR